MANQQAYVVDKDRVEQTDGPGRAAESRSAALHVHASEEILIRPPRGWAAIDVRELAAHRELLYFLIWRDLKVRYKQTALGAVWAVLQPFLTMLVFSIFFGYLAGIPSDGIPYPIFAYTALVPWTYFSKALAHASGSLVEHERLLSKIYLPRLLLPLAPVIAGLVDLAIAFVLLVGMVVWYGITPTAAIWTVPLFVLMAATTAFAVGLWLAALNVQYRDIGYVVPFLTQIWLFATPIAYPSSIVPPEWRTLYGLNPMAGVVEGFRWALLGHGDAPNRLILVSAGTVLVILVGGLFYFRRMEDSFADVV